MNIVRTNIFAPKAAPANDLMVSRTGTDIAGIVTQARQSCGWVAGWRINRAANGQSVELVRRALEDYFAARREELSFRVALTLDAAKKHAVVANLEDTKLVVGEISRIAAAIDSELMKTASDVAKGALLEEMLRLRDLEAALQRGDVTRNSFERESKRIEKHCSDQCDRAERVAQRLIENSGERLEAALRITQPPQR